ncbi:MAG: arginine--tRNA ligase, partial [Aquiluna sp.]|nr:arginine--tRNA ligase [Aquiluna sp.]
MTPEQLSEAIMGALHSLAKAASLDASLLPVEVLVERPKNREHGDWATNIAMQLGSKFEMSPRKFAELLVTHLAGVQGIEKIDIAGPGFINLFVSNQAAGSLLKTIVEEAEGFGRNQSLSGIKLNLEFV